ncbi:MAG: acyltransferase [Rhodanobacter sp.]
MSNDTRQIEQTRFLGVGAWRFLLAGLVAASHLWAHMLQGYAAFAVFAFFVLSGYLMTFVLMHKYGTGARGLADFAFNRIIRIYPSYYVALVLGVITIVVMTDRGIDLTKLNPEFHLPMSGWEWLQPLTLLPIFGRNGLPVAVSNALSIEIGAYLLMPLFARWRVMAWAGVLVSLIAIARYGVTSETFAPRYSEFLPCLIAFATGSLLAHYREHLLAFVMPKTSVIVWMLHGASWLLISSWPWNDGLYVSIVLSAWVTLSLTAYKSTRADVLLGDLSYPVYLVHTIVGAYFVSLLGADRSFAFFAASFSGTILLSYLMTVLVERRMHARKRRSVIHDDQSALASQPGVA